MKHRTLLAAGLLLTGSTAIAADLVAVRANAPATLLRAGVSTALKPQQALMAGDVVSAGSRGKVALQLAGSGLMTFSSLADVQVFEARAASGKLPAIAKLKLLAGAARIDSRAINGKPAQDVRLNVGSLKTRLMNADAWAANTAEGDTLCLMAGVASVQTGGVVDERLELAGSCLRREPDGQLSRFAVDTDPVIVGAIAATRFEEMGPVVSSLMAEASAEEKIAAYAPTVAAELIPTTPSPAAATARVAPPAPAAALPGEHGWTVVVLSMSKPEPVQAQAKALIERGLPATTRTAVVKGMTMHRVAVGSFATQAEARAYAATLVNSGLKGWATPL